jgi:hypothetical protein
MPGEGNLVPEEWRTSIKAQSFTSRGREVLRRWCLGGNVHAGLAGSVDKIGLRDKGASTFVSKRWQLRED